MFFNAFKESEDNLHETLNDLHEDMYENANTTSKVTRNSKPGFTCHPATHSYFKQLLFLSGKCHKENKAETGTYF